MLIDVKIGGQLDCAKSVAVRLCVCTCAALHQTSATVACLQIWTCTNFVQVRACPATSANIKAY